MAGAYAYFENTTATIGNDYIERQFSTENHKLVTTKILNKRIEGGKTLAFKSFSAEFFVGFKRKKLFGYDTDFVSSNDLILDKVNVFKRRVEFVFEPYSYNGAKITFIMNVEIEDNCHYMRKNIEMMVPPEQQHLITLDYIDCEHICFENPEQQWTIGNIDKAYLSKYHSALGQPFYINGMFFGSEFPLAENKIKDSTAYIRYFSGKRFDMLNLNCGHTFKTWNTVAGAARDLEQEVVREDFLTYIRDIARDVKPRFQYNSWYDHMLDITDENISKSFMEIEKNLDKTLVPPLDSYVVDDGFVDYHNTFWSFNEKFPNELYPASSLAKKFSSNFGLWLGPRGGYNNDTPGFAKRMEKAGTGGFNRAALDVCVSSTAYIKNVTDYFIDSMDKFDINYWKLDGFLLKACPSKKHGHMTGGFNDMYQYTEMWENWIDVFRKIRLHRESAGKDLWINQTSYCNASPWFLQWADSFWIQNSTDIGFLENGKGGEKLSSRDFDKVLSYRDDRYYDFSVRRDYQFPHEFIYNHDPIYGNTAKISLTDEDYRTYMLMMATRGTAFWELYYSYNLFNDAKWRINADALRFIRNEYHILKTSRYIGGTPAESQVYGFSSWTQKAGIVSLRNPANYEQEYVLTLDKTLGTFEGMNNMRRAFIYPYSGEVESTLYSYGDSITVKLPPLGAVIMKFSSEEEKLPSLIYGRFDSANELLLFFDDRIYLEEKAVSSDAEIAKTELLEDYSTLKITFGSDVDTVNVRLTVKNAFGDSTTVNFSGKNYPDFVCADGKIPCGRDFTVDCTVDNAKDGNVLNMGEIINISISESVGTIRFGEKVSRGEAEIKNGDRITAVCEPNGLMKLYVNGKLECSAYNSQYCAELENCDVTLSENVSGLRVMSKALSYDEI